MTGQIENSTTSDIDEILKLYQCARDYQKLKDAVIWPIIPNSVVEQEISENRQWKLNVDKKIACVWATTFEDPFIWREKNADPAVYIHRIATNPEFRGNNLVGSIVSWAKEYAKANDKAFVRLDTVGENKKLITYYQQNGFDYLGLVFLKTNLDLPAHYHDAEVCLFEMDLNKK